MGKESSQNDTQLVQQEHPVAVDVDRQQAVSLTNPAGIDCATGCVEVELYIGSQTDRLNTIAVQIEHQRRRERLSRQLLG